MKVYRVHPVAILVLTVLLRMGMCFGQTGSEPTRESFEEMASEPASVRLAKLHREANTILMGRVEREKIITEPNGRRIREYKVSVTECYKAGEPFCQLGPSPVRQTIVRVRPDSDAQAFTAPELRHHGHYIFFLCRPADSEFYVSCGNQGIFQIARTGDDWRYETVGPWARPEDEITVPSGVPSFYVYDRMTFFEFYQELGQAPHLETPLTSINVELLVGSGMSRTHVSRIIEEAKVNFALNTEIQEQLRKVGADDTMLATVARSRATP